ncbi:MAG: hypothetical protein M0P31_06070 [Solirubrobacteraceae bacterium]|nr:hypothetical protein [Solirubrobacteraceae bacterium]
MSPVSATDPTPRPAHLARTAADLDVTWFDALLAATPALGAPGPVRDVRLDPIGAGQMSRVLRAALEHADGGRSSRRRPSRCGSSGCRR